MRALATIALSSLVLYGTGCAELRSEYMPSNGESVSIYDHTTTHTGVQEVATGQDKVRDSTGRLIATSTHYETQAVSWKERNWYPQQGGARVDDESFFRIVDDKQNVARYDHYHQHGKTKNTVGLVLLGAGIALLGGGVGAYEAGKPTTNSDGSVNPAGPLAGVGIVSMTVGLIAACAGGFLAVQGKNEAQTTDQRLVDEPDLFKADARRYDETLAGASPVALSSAAAPGRTPSATAPAPGGARSKTKALSPATSSAEQVAERLKGAGWTIGSSTSNPERHTLMVNATKGGVRAVVSVKPGTAAIGARKSGHAVSDEDDGFIFDVRCPTAKDRQDEIMTLLVGAAS